MLDALIAFDEVRRYRQRTFEPDSNPSRAERKRRRVGAAEVAAPAAPDARTERARRWWPAAALPRARSS